MLCQKCNFEFCWMCLGAYPNYIHTEYTACPLKYTITIMMCLIMFLILDMKLSYIFEGLSYAQFMIIYYVPMFVLFNLYVYQVVGLLFITTTEFIHWKSSWYFLLCLYVTINSIVIYGFCYWKYFREGLWIIIYELSIVVILISVFLIFLGIYKLMKWVCLKIKSIYITSVSYVLNMKVF